MIVTLTLASLLAAAPTATTAESLLSMTDEAMNRAQDQQFEYEMIDHAPGKDPRSLALTVSIKGDKRLSELSAPADVRGTKVLVLSPTQMYIYLPAYKKVRRIASHVTEQGFMGTAYASADLSLVTFGDKYTAKLLGETRDAWKLEMTAKPGMELAYPKVVVTVGKQLRLPDEIEFWSADGVKLKTEQRIGYECQGKVCTAKTHKMTDHSSNGHWTELVRKGWKVNPGLKDDLFTQRYLQKS